MARFISTIGFSTPPQPSILIVNDDVEAGRTLSTILQAAKFRTRCAPAGRLERMLSAGLPDFVVADCGIGGVAVCDTIKRVHPLLPVVVALPDDSARLSAIRAGADHVMVHPLAIDELLARATWLVELGARHTVLSTKLETLRMWHDWVRYLVHDLRNPVTIAMGKVSFARDQNADAGVDRNLGSAERALTEISMMLRDLLDTDRIQHGALAPQKEEVDLAELATSVASSLPAEHKVEVSVDGDTKISGDRILLGRVFSNLMLNATRFARERPVHVDVTGGAHGVSARVINDGPGIAPELEPHLFEPWRRAGADNQGATGIGLAFCRLVCEAHDGKIWLEDATSGKVTFAFGIPRPPPTELASR